MNSFNRVLVSFVTGSMVLYGAASTVVAAELELADEPLFLGISTDPNVFFELDDSGSMDWTILTIPYYHSCQYDRDSPGSTGDYNCSTSIRNDGLWRSYGNGSFRSYYYMFDASDNAYATGCGFYDYSYNVKDCGFTDVFSNDWRGGSSSFNVVYYNPTVTYSPWAGTGLTDASFTAARSDPQPAVAAVSAQAETNSQVAIPAQSARGQTYGYTDTQNLEDFVYYIWEDSHGFDDDDDYPKRGSNINRTTGANGWVDLWDNYYKYTVKAGSVEWEKVEWTINASSGSMSENIVASGSFSGTSTDPNVTPALTTAKIQQNIANWYSYSRRRSYVVKGAVGAVVSGSPSFRFGQTVINESSTLFNEVPPADVTKYSGYNQDLLNDLYSFNWPARGTPLRKGLEKAGEYISGNLSGKADPIIQSCQQNFTVLFTDGYWNGYSPSSTIDDRDGDGRKITVADVARYYYDHDLDTNLSDNVVPNVADPAEYQHMVTFPVAFGVTGDLVDTDSPEDGWPNPVLTESNTWGDNPASYNSGKIDDLWHAAYNSRGEYVAAQTPEEVLSSLTAALSEISSRDAASASVATSTGQISSSTAVFQAQFNSGDWSGRLYSFPLKADDSVDILNPNWQAGTVLDGLNFDTGRAIISNNGTTGITFRFPSDYATLSASDFTHAQLSELLVDAPYSLATGDTTEKSANQAFGESLINYLRGDRSNEGVSAGDFRPRSSVLGDIVDSDPKYVSQPSFFYPETLESSSYSSFRKTHENRKAMVYVGANDGMLHAFDAANGKELMSYVPSTILGELHALTDPAYFHKFFVNAAPTIVDAHFSGSWHTVLAGALGRGGQGVFGLDVTNPAGFSEANAASIFLWEFDDTDDADMGYSYSEPSIAKMANGKWVAVFGNGYNNTEADGAASTTGNSVLYIVDLGTGAVIKKIDTGVGSATTPNGMATPALVDVDNDYVVDYIYAGDLYGNMWKFDVTDTNSTNWDVAWVSGTTKKPLFATATGQAITTRPAVGLHPDEDGQMIYFGTGKYIETDDNNSLGEPDQSFYGIWDQNESVATGLPVISSDLLLQTIDYEFSTTLEGNTYNLRITSDETIDWQTHEGWRIDLVNRNNSPVDNQGERQVSEAILRNGRIIFPTNLPSDTPCTPGGTSWLMELDARDGSRLDETPFDLNGDGIFSELDYTYGVESIPDVPASGIQSDEGIISTPGILRDKNREVKYLSGSTGAISNFSESTGAQNIGRQSWRELE
ncbi:pilus assembly protein [Teredinibacter purpureus]|uniref:pilus assembly protein n=1 Tax=Teredinibacter purpureus TaxID=2731756 RepID=UPI0006986A5F|nr:PilC/PilY family type IV pilus protein [Teredinibacter purpureus]